METGSERPLLRFFLWILGVMIVGLLRPYVFLPIAMLRVIAFALLGEIINLLDYREPDGREVADAIRSRSPVLFQRCARQYAAFGEHPDFNDMLKRDAYTLVLIVLLIFVQLVGEHFTGMSFFLVFFWAGIVLLIGLVFNTVILLVYYNMYNIEIDEKNKVSPSFVFNPHQASIDATQPAFGQDFEGEGKSYVLNHYRPAGSEIADYQHNYPRTPFLRLAHFEDGKIIWYDDHIYTISAMLTLAKQVNMLDSRGNEVRYVLYKHLKHEEPSPVINASLSSTTLKMLLMYAAADLVKRT